jgi:DNA-binding MarR family transcriptional regulator
MARMDVGMATRRVQALVDAGLVARRTDPSDGRVSVIETTADGERAAGALHEVRRDHLARALSDWSAAELQQLDRLLTRFFEDTTKTPINGGRGQARQARRIRREKSRARAKGDSTAS